MFAKQFLQVFVNCYRTQCFDEYTYHSCRMFIRSDHLITDGSYTKAISISVNYHIKRKEHKGNSFVLSVKYCFIGLIF